MGVYIPNMKMPHNCIECPRLEWYTDEDGFDRSYCQERVLYPSTIDRPTDCPLIEIEDEAIDIAQDIIDGCKGLKERVDKGIVRCGECKWLYIDDRDDTMWCVIHLSHYYVNADYFCSYREREGE